MMKLVKDINPYIFRGYDIRGIYKTEIDEDVAYTIGKSFGSKLIDLGHSQCLVGQDNRYSSPSLTSCLITGILSSGINVVDLGVVTTPIYYYASIKEKIGSGIMVTASHNPKNENGFKFAYDNTGNASGEIIEEFRTYTSSLKFHEGKGTLTKLDIKESYFKLIKDSISLGSRPLKVVIDCGNGTTSLFAKELYSLFNLDLTVLFGDSNPDFPNHHPDPSVEANLAALKAKVLEINADIGLSFDGDGDRLGIIDETGSFIAADKYMIILARYLLPKSSNKRVLYDVKCTKALPDEIIKLGGTPLCSRTGNSYTKRYTKEWDCLMGAELSGHIYFRDKFLGFDSGMYAGLRLLEVLSNTNQSLSSLLVGINKYYATDEIKIQVPDSIKFKVIEEVKNYALTNHYTINEIDGVKIEFSNGWALIRASNTGPNITARFEGISLAIKDELYTNFMKVISNIIESLR
ncbi:MAG: phosphomannomutase/phosphoglucomutase [Bacilli bacterium]